MTCPLVKRLATDHPTAGTRSSVSQKQTILKILRFECHILMGALVFSSIPRIGIGRGGRNGLFDVKEMQTWVFHQIFKGDHPTIPSIHPIKNRNDFGIEQRDTSFFTNNLCNHSTIQFIQTYWRSQKGLIKPIPCEIHPAGNFNRSKMQAKARKQKT